MNKLIVAILISFGAFACSNSSEEETRTVDTTIIGSDNPHPTIDTSRKDQADSLRK